LTEIDVKLSRIRAYLLENDFDAMALTLQSNFAWLTAGGDNRVYSATETGASSLLVTPDRALLIANNIETPRLIAEELVGKGFEVITYPWYENDGLRCAIDRVVGTDRIASDTAMPRTENRAAEIAGLRYSLTPEEADRYRWLAMGTAFAVQDACHSLEPGITEHMVAAEVGGALLANGIQPALLLIATDERIAKFRHPLPTDQKLVRSAMVVAGGRKWGLVACVTRLVHFGPVPSDLARRHEAVCHVDASLIAATRPGTAVSDLFSIAVRAYEESSYPDEWRLHHQEERPLCFA